MSRLPPPGSGYSGRSTSSGRYVTKPANGKSRDPSASSKTSARSDASGKFVTPPKGSAGVSRAK